MTEIWKPIPDFAYYEASSQGRIRRKAGTPRCPVARVLAHGTVRVRPKRLPYFYVNLSTDNLKHSMLIHRLIALAFHGLPPTPEHQVAHTDGNCQNNAADNIRWATVAENKADYKTHGRTWRDTAIARAAKGPARTS